MKLLFLTALASLMGFSQLQAADKIQVVSFSTILTEIAERVGGAHVEVAGLVQARGRSA